MIYMAKPGPKPGSKHKNLINRKFNTKPGETGLTKLFGGYQRNAVNANREFSLDREQFRYLTSKNCFYCGTSPKQVSRPYSQTMSEYSSERGIYIYNGLDRLKNTEGYTSRNVVPCCMVCNRGKGTMHWSEFKLYISSILLRSEL